MLLMSVLTVIPVFLFSIRGLKHLGNNFSSVKAGNNVFSENLPPVMWVHYLMPLVEDESCVILPLPSTFHIQLSTMAY